MKISNRCSMCGSSSWYCINTYRSGFSFGRSLLASILLGRNNGIWLGMLGKRRKVYACQNCRFLVEYKN